MFSFAETAVHELRACMMTIAVYIMGFGQVHSLLHIKKESKVLQATYHNCDYGDGLMVTMMMIMMM